MLCTEILIFVSGFYDALMGLMRNLNWQTVFLILVLAGGKQLCQLADALTHLIRRIKSGRFQNNEFNCEPSVEEQKEGNTYQELPPGSDINSIRTDVSKVVSLEQIDKIIKSHNIESINEPVLRYLYATLIIFLGHEKNYRRIFGSQLKLLEQIKAHGTVSKDQARQIYDQAKLNYPDLYAKYGFESWCSFLETSSLIIHLHDQINLTDFGHGFLTYIIKENLGMYKPY